MGIPAFQTKILPILLKLPLVSCPSGSSGALTGSDQAYISENIEFYNKEAQIQIAGTLTYPEGDGPFPALVLVPGSGNTNRDGSDNDFHQPLFEIADYLTRRGMAVLRCDKRGVGESEGVLDFNTTLSDLASDVNASVDYLSHHPLANKDQIGLLGHSYGGLVAAAVVGNLPPIVFIVLLATPGINNGQILRQQMSDIPGAFGVKESTIGKFQTIIDSIMILLSSKEENIIQSKMIGEMYARRISQVTDEEMETRGNSGYLFQRNAEAYARMVLTPFWHEFFTLDPGSIFLQVKCPVLSIAGENDMQVRPGPNQGAIRQALESGHNEDFTVITIQGMNHLFLSSKSGSPEEYKWTRATMSNPVLDTVSSWISDRLDY